VPRDERWVPRGNGMRGDEGDGQYCSSWTGMRRLCTVIPKGSRMGKREVNGVEERPGDEDVDQYCSSWTTVQ
jgi:hypothetical protein